MADEAAQPFRGDFVAWNGGSVLLGEGASQIAPHEHYAIQLVLGAPVGLRVQFGRRGPWEECAAALIPSRAVHTIDADRCRWGAVLFVEPETREGRALGARLAGRMERLDADLVAVAARRLEHAWRTESDAGAVASVCTQWLRELAGTESPVPSDARILAAIERIRQHVDQPVSLQELAALAHLSPSRFRHLFVQETGMPLRTYVLWRRMLHVWPLLMRGQTLSAAAHAAGFADSSHLSRTARKMFGLPPSAFRMNGPLSRRARTAPHGRG